MSRKETAIFLTLLIFFVFYQRPPSFANRYLFLTYSIVDNKALNIDLYHEGTGDKSFYEGHYYLAANPGLSLMAVPVYGATRFLPKIFTGLGARSHTINHLSINILLNSLLVCLTAVMFFRVLSLWGLDEGRKTFLSLALGLGTISFNYSLEYFAASTVGTFFAFLSFYILTYANAKGGNELYFSPPLFRLFASGLCCGTCVLIGFEYVFFAVVFWLYAASRLKFSRLALFTAAICLSLLPLLIYQKLCFGGYLTTYGSHMVAKEFTSDFEAGFMGFSEFSWAVLGELAVGLRRGYFSHMPIMLLPMAGIVVYACRSARRKPFARLAPVLPSGALRETVFAAALPVVYLLSFSASSYWEGGSSFGPRYFLATVPFFLLLAAYAFERVPMWAACALGGASILVNWLAAQFRYTGETNLLDFFRLFADNGPSSAFTLWLTNNAGLPEALVRSRTVAFVNLACLAVIAIFLARLWKRALSDRNRVPAAAADRQ